METDDTILNISYDHNEWLVDDFSFTDTITIDNSTSSDFVIKRPGKPSMNVAETLECIMDRLAILEPDLDKMEHYPALQKAYDNYKLIEALIAGEDTDNGT